MKFSNKAYKYLDKLKRDKEYTYSEKTGIINYFKTQGLPVFEKVVEFQVDYSGLILTISGAPLSTYYAQLYSVSDIKANAQIDFFQLEGQYYFYCGHHETAQFWFVLGEDGQVFTYDNERQSVNPIFTSFEKLIEAYAFEDLLRKNKKYELPYFYEVIDPLRYGLLTKDWFRHSTANDSYNEWLSKDDLIIYTGRRFDRPISFVHLYGDSKTTCEGFIKVLKSENIIA